VYAWNGQNTKNFEPNEVRAATEEKGKDGGNTVLKRIPIVLSLIIGALLAFGCGEEDPSKGGDYFPMSVGDYWVYEEIDPTKPTVTLRYEVTRAETTETDSFEGSYDALVLTNTFPGGTDEFREQFIVDDGTRAERIKHDIYDDFGEPTKLREYEPGFLRFDRSQQSKDDEWAESVIFYTSIDPEADPLVFEANELQFNYRVVEEHQEVTVPAGTFNCIVIERSVLYGTAGETKIYYFAPGVGKVKEITEDVKEENLIEYSVAPPADDAV
jgi:hypothetical protein